MLFFAQMAESYGTDSEITEMMNKLTFVVIPVLNVDGYAYSWTNVSFFFELTPFCPDYLTKAF